MATNVSNSAASQNAYLKNAMHGDVAQAAECAPRPGCATPHYDQFFKSIKGPSTNQREALAQYRDMEKLKENLASLIDNLMSSMKSMVNTIMQALPQIGAEKPNGCESPQGLQSPPQSSPANGATSPTTSAPVDQFITLPNYDLSGLSAKIDQLYPRGSEGKIDKIELQYATTSYLLGGESPRAEHAFTAAFTQGMEKLRAAGKFVSAKAWETVAQEAIEKVADLGLISKEKAGDVIAISNNIFNDGHFVQAGKSPNAQLRSKVGISDALSFVDEFLSGIKAGTISVRPKDLA